MLRELQGVVRRPAVMHQDPDERFAQDFRDHVEAPRRTDRIEGGRFGHEVPQPPEPRVHPPTRLVGRDLIGVSNVDLDSPIDRFRPVAESLDPADERRFRHDQPEVDLEERSETSVRDAEFLVEVRRQPQRPGADLVRGGPERVRGLLRVASLEAFSTPAAAPDMHAEPGRAGRRRDREVRLVLVFDIDLLDGVSAVGALLRERSVDGLVHARGDRPRRGERAVALPRPASRLLRVRLRRPFRERRRWTLRRAERFFEQAGQFPDAGFQRGDSSRLVGVVPAQATVLTTEAAVLGAKPLKLVGRNKPEERNRAGTRSCHSHTRIIGRFVREPQARVSGRIPFPSRGERSAEHAEHAEAFGVFGVFGVFGGYPTGRRR